MFFRQCRLGRVLAQDGDSDLRKALNLLAPRLVLNRYYRELREDNGPQPNQTAWRYGLAEHRFFPTSTAGSRS